MGLYACPILSQWGADTKNETVHSAQIPRSPEESDRRAIRRTVIDRRRWKCGENGSNRRVGVACGPTCRIGADRKSRTSIAVYTDFKSRYMFVDALKCASR